MINNLGIYRLLESTMTLQIGLYHTMNDLKLHIPYAMKLKSYLEQSILMSAYPYLRHPLQFVK